MTDNGHGQLIQRRDCKSL